MVSKTKKRQSKRLNRNISFGSDVEGNGEITPSNRTRDDVSVQGNTLPENEIQSMIESAVVRALSSYGVNTNTNYQSKQSETAQSNSKANNRQSCNSDQHHNRSRDGYAPIPPI